MTPYTVASVSKKAMRRSTTDSQTEYGDLEDENTVESEQDSDSDGELLSSKPAIKVQKASGSQKSSQNNGKGKSKMGSHGNDAKKKRAKS